MSKRVEVMSKDTWAVNKYGVLHQIRGTKHRPVASTYVEAFSWVDGLDGNWHRVYTLFAKAVITGLGGEWAEVAEERQPQTVIAVDYMHDNGTIWRCVGNSESHKHVEAEIAAGRSPYRRITIAGVT